MNLILEKKNDLKSNKLINYNLKNGKYYLK
jgi:hypothetical protein